MKLIANIIRDRLENGKLISLKEFINTHSNMRGGGIENIQTTDKDTTKTISDNIKNI